LQCHRFNPLQHFPASTLDRLPKEGSTLLTTARSTAINSALSAVFEQRNVANFQATAHQQKEERNRSSQVRKPQPPRQTRKPMTRKTKKTAGGTEEKIGPTVVVSEQETSRPRNHQRTFLLDSHHDDKQQSFFLNDRYLTMSDSFSVSLKQQERNQTEAADMYLSFYAKYSTDRSQEGAAENSSKNTVIIASLKLRIQKT
jgi:hypothetical protein